MTKIYSWDLPRLLAEKQLLEAVCKEFECTPEDIQKSNRGKRGITDARSVFAYLLKKHFHYTLEAIGEKINRDHSAVFHAIQRVDGYIIKRDYVKDLLDDIENKFLTINKNL